MPKVTVTVLKIGRLVRRARQAVDRIRVTVDRINQVRDEINQARARIDDIRQRIDAIRNNPVTQAWRDTAEGAAFVQRMQEASADIASMVNVITRFGTVLQNSAQNFQQTQQAVRNIAEGLARPNRTR